mmetsp:Transcript_14006/g.18258  ORF Transcript_14006/g.18258 Transcript_14006/m.18258 type:complete len:388 (+) Transcript_14006:178-1341(+)|eukprot:CAMPEP_0198143882 /NCGR_PEP_ID=MMETSP1443-20131203/11289_1 /TAXON_ID=186043 /ORGANISM="Entomoneis sp., Strain CCMP2396" /LENGTH=387 /DNA_ID=CAMNT_0043807183 /DNA_START=83 /DNA_END=1246 /DNA_ORIENTATION=+
MPRFSLAVVLVAATATAVSFWTLPVSSLHIPNAFPAGIATRTRLQLNGRRSVPDCVLASFRDKDNGRIVHDCDCNDANDVLQETGLHRREAMQSIARNALAISLGVTMAPSLESDGSAAANASYRKEYPGELNEPSDPKFALDGRERQLAKIREKEAKGVSSLELGPTYKPLISVLWGGALWLLSGSRSNPVVTPLANLLFSNKKEEQDWLQDRNDGLFADVPPSLYVVLAILFCAFGFAADSFLVLLAEGDRNLSLQLAGVTLIFGASLELGRLANGEKKETRQELDRSDLLQQEFAEFAQERITFGGNCHRNEVVNAFRRYYAKYRQADSKEYPLGGLEIERLLRDWTRQQKIQQQAVASKIEMSSAGFYSGIQINSKADVFVQR